MTRSISNTERELNKVVHRRNVLLLAIRHMNDLFAYNEQPGNDSYRHAAYRQYVLWRFHRLGSGNRVVIPSCAVWSIKDRYPSIDGTHTRCHCGRCRQMPDPETSCNIGEGAAREFCKRQKENWKRWFIVEMS